MVAAINRCGSNLEVVAVIDRFRASKGRKIVAAGCVEQNRYYYNRKSEGIVFRLLLCAGGRWPLGRFYSTLYSVNTAKEYKVKDTSARFT